MKPKLIEIVERRTTLVAKAAAQRAELSRALAAFRRPLAMVDLGLMVIRYTRNHVPLLVGVAAFLVPFRPWRMAHAVKRILPVL